MVVNDLSLRVRCAWVSVASLLLTALLLATTLGAQSALPSAIQDSRIKGGLCVIVGGNDTLLAAAIARSGPFIVQALIADAARVDAARSELLRQRLHGQVTVAPLTGSALPYADHLVSLLVVLDQGIAM